MSDPKPVRYPENLPVRKRIAGHLIAKWKRWKKSVPEGTQREFAKGLGVHEGTISKILSGKNVTSVGLDLVIALWRDGLDVTWAFGDEASNAVPVSGEPRDRLPKPRAAESPPIQVRATGHGSSR